MSSYSHYCRKCEKYFSCTHPDPEKATAKCPICKSNLYLQQKSLGEVTRELHLSQSEISQLLPTYVSQ